MTDHSAIDHTGLTGAGGSVATDAIFDAKGDLAVGTGANTAAKLTVGANDTIPMADSGQATGIKWVASQTPSTQAFGDAAAEGTADTYARGDHKHAIPRIICGRVNADGTEANDPYGAFTSTKNATGDYTVTYSAFSAAPAVVVFPYGRGAATFAFLNTDPTTTTFNVFTTNFSASNADSEFSFIVIGA